MMSAGSGSIYRHMVTALLTYHLSSVTNSHLILGYLLGLMWVRGLGHQVLGLGLVSQVLVIITATALVLFIAENVTVFSAMFVREFVCLLIGLRFPKNRYQLVLFYYYYVTVLF